MIGRKKKVTGMNDEDIKRQQPVSLLAETPVLLFDINGKIVDINAAFCEATGLQKDDLAGTVCISALQ